ncbi:MAG TPA: hypothetical protein VFD58_05045 [Blastocatellia bacterium]|nr:hypothetical protein [Blastocatellia bacterium]
MKMAKGRIVKEKESTWLSSGYGLHLAMETSSDALGQSTHDMEIEAEKSRGICFGQRVPSPFPSAGMVVNGVG